MIRVAVAGAAGRMGEAVCRAVSGASDMTLSGRADPTLGVSVADVLPDADVLVDFTTPSTVVENARAALAAGVHAVIGTTGFTINDLVEAVGSEAGASANIFIAPNFAIGAVLMMRFAAEAAPHMARAEIIELHHDRKLDSTDRESFMPGVLLAIRRVGELPESPVVGLERLLF